MIWAVSVIFRQSWRSSAGLSLGSRLAGLMAEVVQNQTLNWSRESA